MEVPARGEVWWWESEEAGRRPVVVLSRDESIPRRRRAIVAPCTTTRRDLPTEVPLDPGSDPVPVSCVVNLDSADDVSIALLVRRLGRLGSDRMDEVCRALAIAVDC